MNCERIEAALLAVVDGRATPEDRRRVETHVATCDSCARRIEEMRGVWTSLDRLEGLEPSPAFDARLRARMAEQQARAGWRAWLPSHLRLVAVTAALLAVAVWVSLRPARRPAAPAPENQEDFAVVKNLPVLENYDVIANFDALSALPGAQTTAPPKQASQQQQME